MLSLIYNNKDSISDLGIDLIEKPSQPIPTKRITKIEVPGRDGLLTIDEGSYEPIELEVNFNFTSTDFNKKVREIKQWLLDATNKELKLNYLDGYYRVNSLSISDIERVDVVESGKFKVKFLCDPFLYDTLGKEIITLNYSASTQYLVNDGYKALPYIKIYGTGTLTLTINGLAMVFTSVVGYVEVDSDLVNCYKDATNKNNTMTGLFPILENGSNSISMSSGITKIELIPRWKSL